MLVELALAGILRPVVRPSWLLLSLSLHGALLGIAGIAMHGRNPRPPLRPPHVELQSSLASELVTSEALPPELARVMVEAGFPGEAMAEPLQDPVGTDPLGQVAAFADGLVEAQVLPERDGPSPRPARERLREHAVLKRPAPPSPVAAEPVTVPPAVESVAVVDAVAPPPQPSAAYVPARQRADNAAPEYPSSERAMGHEGTVVVAVRIDAQGIVVEVSLAEPSAHPGLNRAALRAVRAWRFEPALQQGRPVEGWLDVPVVFRLRDR